MGTLTLRDHTLCVQMHLLVTAPFLGSDPQCGLTDRLWDGTSLSVPPVTFKNSAFCPHSVLCCQYRHHHYHHRIYVLSHVRKTAFPNALNSFAVYSLYVWFYKQYQFFSPPDRYTNIAVIRFHRHTPVCVYCAVRTGS